MKASLFNLDRRQIFEIFVLFWITFGWVALLISLFGIFYNAIIIAFVVLGVVALLTIFAVNRQEIQSGKFSLLVIAFSMLTVFTFSYYTVPTVFSGRDQGSFSEAAIRLSQNHQLKYSTEASREFFKIYGPGKALNFPGFDYTKDGQLTTQFPLGYTSWLAAFYGIFGLNGFVFANGICFFIFLLSFYLIVRQFAKFRSALLSLFFITSSFVFSWFFKFTLSENMALMLLWFGIYEFLMFQKTNERFHFFLFFSAVALLTFSRIEALAFLAVAFAVLLFKNRNWKELIIVKIGRSNLYLITAFIFLYLINIAVNVSSYIALIKGALKPFLFLGTGLEETKFLLMPIYVLKIFMAYAILGYIVVGIIGIVYLFKRKNFSHLIPLIIISPAFIYLLQPAISIDHPWMLRRFLFAVIPAGILYTTVFLDNFIKKRILFYFISSVLIVTNLIVFLLFIRFLPHKDLLVQVESLSKNFYAKDLVLVDQGATGDGWSMLTGPMSFLYGKQAIYFFNPADLDKLDTKKFSNIYFVIPDDNLQFYEKSGLLEKISAQNLYTMTNNLLDAKAGDKRQALLSDVSLPEKNEFYIQGKIYLLKKEWR